MCRKKETSEQLRERILQAMKAQIGISERMALPFVDVVLDCFAGERLYFPAKARSYPLGELQKRLERGDSVDAICKDHGLSRRQLHRLFPGGLGKGNWRDTKPER